MLLHQGLESFLEKEIELNSKNYYKNTIKGNVFFK